MLLSSVILFSWAYSSYIREVRLQKFFLESLLVLAKLFLSSFPDCCLSVVGMVRLLGKLASFRGGLVRSILFPVGSDIVSWTSLVKVVPQSSH